MAKQTPEEKEQERARKRAERKTHSQEAMEQGPDVYAKRIIANVLQVPFIHFFYSLFYIVFDYIFGGHIIVKTWQKLLIKAGYISEGALGVASLWAIINHVAILHNLFATNPVTKPIIDPMNGFMMASFTLIPDLILASAIIITINRWKTCRNKEERALSILWALVYTIPTIAFSVLTFYTLGSVGSVAGSGDVSNVVYASGTELQVRVLSAYFYALIEVLYAFTHHGHSHQVVSTGNQTPAFPPTDDLQALISQQIIEATNKLAGEQQQMMADLSGRFEQAINLLAVKQQGLLTTIQEVREEQKTLQIAGPDGSKSEIVNTVLDQLKTVFLEQQSEIKTPQIPEHKNARNEDKNAGNKSTKTLETKTQKHPTKTRDIDIAKRTRKIPDEEVDAVVWPLKNRDRSLTHRKIAPLVPYSETLVYASLKRWTATQPIVSGDVETEEKSESGVS